MADRDEKGHFLKGHKIGGPGRPRRPVEEKFLDALTGAVSIEDWKTAVRALLEKAMGGDERAFAVLASYLIGKPTEYVAADLTSGGESLVRVVYVNKRSGAASHAE